MFQKRIMTKAIMFLFIILSFSLVAQAVSGPLDHIVVSPSTKTVTSGETYTFTATGYDSNNNIVSINPTWSINNNSVGTIDTTNGVFTADKVGTAIITATNGSISKTATVTVIASSLDHIVVSPSTEIVALGNIKKFNATGYDVNGNKVPISPTWSIDNTSVGTIDATTGLFTADKVGTATIKATNGSVNGTATVTTVEPGPLVRITISPSTATVTSGSTQTFNATGYDANNNIVSITLNWSIDNNSVGTIDNSGLFTANKTGTANITASNGSINGIATVTVIPGSLARITVSPTTLIIASGNTSTFNATGYDTNNNTVSISPTWSIDNSSVGTIDATTGVFTAKKIGTAEITAMDGSITETATVTVTSGPLDHIVVSPSNSTIISGETQKFTAIGYDINGNEVPINPTWSVNDTSIGTINSSGVFTAKKVGSVAINATDGNIVGTAIENVRSKTYYSGNRIWDGGRPLEFALDYTWTPMSFSGFYYDLDDDVGNESIKITLQSYDDRLIDENDLLYTTKPQEVRFGYSSFGKYQVIGFMAEKYFAGYTNDVPSNQKGGTVKQLSALSKGELHKVLIDDDNKRTVSVGGTLTLKDGYVLKATDIDAGARSMLITLLKDGNEVDTTPLSAGDTYVYSKKVGTIHDLPLIIVHFDTVFSGTETQAAFLKGLFQISETVTKVKVGNSFGIMKVTKVTRDEIQMKNDGEIDLSKASTQDLMGDIKIIVADSDTLRFALSVEKAGTYEVRSTIFDENKNSLPFTWTPYNFGMNIGKTSIGFYYDLDDDIGTEKFELKALSGSSIDTGDLIYTTEPQDVSFGYSDFGKYKVIGFMAEKYFAGYTNDVPRNQVGGTVKEISTLSKGELHKVLIDDDEKRTISVGGTLTLKEGYVLKATDIDASARTMLIVLLKDGDEVDTTPLSAGETYVYSKKVGSVSDLPIIIVHFDSVFSGSEAQAAFLKGLFQISESTTKVKQGNMFGIMKVKSVGSSKLEMQNDDSIEIDGGNTQDIMGNIKLKSADSSDTRFYFKVDVEPEMIADQLLIDAPDRATAGDSITIKVTAAGQPIDNVAIKLVSDIGTTDSNGELTYTLPKDMQPGRYNITATKLGYESDSKNIDISEYIYLKLNIEAPAKALQGDEITIKVIHDGTPLKGATLKFDNQTIGYTDENGLFNYTLTSSGTHKLSATKEGYITVTRDIDIAVPYSEFKTLNFNVSPTTVFIDQNITVTADITNVGNKQDTLPVELKINNYVVDSKSVTLAPNQEKTIYFKGNMKQWFSEDIKLGNYTIAVLDKEQKISLIKKPVSVFVWALILTIIAAILIYVVTAKGDVIKEAYSKAYSNILSKIKR